jgi:hypothetical protein
MPLHHTPPPAPSPLPTPPSRPTKPNALLVRLVPTKFSLTGTYICCKYSYLNNTPTTSIVSETEAKNIEHYSRQHASHILKIKMLCGTDVFLKSSINMCRAPGSGLMTAASELAWAHFVTSGGGSVVLLTCGSLAATWDWSRQIYSCLLGD